MVQNHCRTHPAPCFQCFKYRHFNLHNWVRKLLNLSVLNVCMCVFLICAIFRSLLLLGENQNKKYRVGDDRYEREREREGERERERERERENRKPGKINKPS